MALLSKSKFIKFVSK